MTTFAVTNSDQLLPAVNYLLSNLDTQTVSGNITIPGNVLVANTTTGVVSQSGNATPFAYLYQYVNLRYSNNATGTSGFDVNSNNYSYFGVFNSSSPTPSSNPASYQWYEVDPPFDSATSRTLYYSAIGGRQIQWAAASSPPSSNYVITVANVAIDLDVVTTAAGTPGERGPVVMAAVITTADPNTASPATLTGWFEASRSNVSAPIGTGLTPVTGDTASFTWAAGAGQPQAAYEYNGSIWIPVNGQVVSGNVIVRGTIAGNAMIANTITATQIATGTITATQIAANTITAGQIAANTITSGQIAAGTITGNNIAAGTITTNNFTANTIQGNIIAAGTITATQLAANAITANTVVSTGAVLNNNASLGFWLDGPSGNARFGNSISIGNQLTVGSGATIGTNLIVGNNAQIGGNLFVSGLVTSGSLDANTVATTTIVPNGVTSTARGQVGVVVLATTPVSGTIYTTPGATITTTQFNQTVVIYMNLGMQLQLTAVGGSATRFGQLVTTLQRYDSSSSPPGLTLQSTSKFFQVTLPTSGSGSNVISVSQVYPTFVDTVASPGTYVYAFGGGVIYSTSLGTVTSTLRTYQNSIDDTIFLNTISALGLKR
jgi:hypothetical protein